MRYRAGMQEQQLVARVAAWVREHIVIVILVPLAIAIFTAYLFGFLDSRTHVGPNSVHQKAEDEAPELDARDYSGGWGSERELFTMSEPAPYAVLNSITDDKQYGDQRNFVQVRNVTADGKFADEVHACAGDLIEVFFLAANNASDSLASTAATVHGLEASLVTGGTGTPKVSLGVVLSAKNASTVWDGADISCRSSGIKLTYLQNSAKLYSNLAKPADYFTLDRDVFSEHGGPIGARGADGELPVGRVSGEDAGTVYVLLTMMVTAT